MNEPFLRRATSSTTLRASLIVIAVTGALAGGLAYRNHHRYKHFEVHDANRVYRSAWLEPDAIAELVRTQGLRTVVNLCNPGEMGDERWDGERTAVRNAGARLVELPMPLDISSDEQLVAPHVALLKDPDSYPMLVHCQHGVTRTAKFLLLYDMLIRDMPAEESLSAMPLFGRDDHNVHVRAYARLLDAERSKASAKATAKAPSVRQ